MTAHASRPPIFIVGAPRSGTTLLRDLLRSHPAISITPESHFIPRFHAAWGDPRSDRQARALARRILSLRTIRRWELELGPQDFASCRSFAEVVDRLFSELARAQGKPRWGDKTPQYVESLPTLAELFPEARFLHIYRDGRDVARSWADRSFSPGNLYRATRHWRRMVLAGRRSGRALGERYLELRYESLLDQPRETMRGVCDFVGEPFTEAVIQPTPRQGMYSSGLSEAAQIEPTRAQRWRESMPLADRALVESVAADLLAELGYELEGLARPISPGRSARYELAGSTRAALNRVRSPRWSVADLLLDLRAEARATLGRTAPLPRGAQPPTR